MSEWMTMQQANFFGAIAGAVFGALGGGVTGSLVGLLTPRGRAKKLVLGVLSFWLTLGVGLLATGVFALIVGQPGHVVKPFMLTGSITTLVMGMMLPMTVGVYRQADRRRMVAEELRRG